jgi:hypothetical protein
MPNAETGNSGYHNPAMRRAKGLRLGILTIAASCLMLCVTPTSRAVGGALASSLDDRTFWAMVNEFSEPGGSFRSDNLVSNETEFQHVIPALREQQAPASAYVGVGPDQNFTYIVALHPRIAFVVDIRRQNMLLHLMYKALIEMSPTRADFLSHLFSRARPEARASVSADALFAALEQQPADARQFDSNFAEIRRRLTHLHRFNLSTDDLFGVEYVYRAFYAAGPDVRYSFGRGSGWAPFPTYRDLMVENDGVGVQRSYLASEENYQALRDLEERNLVVPVVGDFAGPKALRSVAAFLRSHGASVTAFYTSNVEQYLFRGDDWERFYANVGALPIERRSTFIRAIFNNTYASRGLFRFQPAPFPLPPPPQPMPPRSVTVLNPIAEVVAAVNEGRLRSYRDLVDLSR